MKHKHYLSQTFHFIQTKFVDTKCYKNHLQISKFVFQFFKPFNLKLYTIFMGVTALNVLAIDPYISADFVLSKISSKFC